MPESVADEIIAFLDKQGIEFIFSHPGGPVLPLYDAIRKRSSPKNILVRHEGPGSFMAEAYAKVTGRVGVCMSTMGPGAENMLIGIGTAMSDSTPVIAITGQLPIKSLGRGYQQETDHCSLYSAVTKASVQLKEATSAIQVFERAYKIAISGRPGPVHIDVPVDISSSIIQDNYEPHEVKAPELGPSKEELVVTAAQLIAKASSPVILVGGGVIIGNSSKELEMLAESTGIPVASSYNGRGSIPETNPLSIGRVGENTPSYARRLMGLADLIIAVGYRFTDVSTEGWSLSKGTQIIQIDIDPTEIGKNVEITLGMVGDAKQVLPQILRELQRQSAIPLDTKDWLKQLQEAKEEWFQKFSKDRDSNSVPIKPQRIMKEIAAVLSDKSIVVAGAGRSKMWAASLLPIRGARTWIHSGGYAVMGYELCAAISCKLAKPEADVIAVCGDASFQMVCQELATAIENKAPFVACVLNDGSLGSIKDAQVKKYGYTFGTEFSLDVDLAEVARSFGALAQRITKPDELAPALKQSLEHDKPSVLDIIVDGSELPNLEY